MRMVGWMIKNCLALGYMPGKIFGESRYLGNMLLEFEDESAVSGHGYVLGECYGFTGDNIACNGV